MPTYREYSRFCEQISQLGIPMYTAEKACNSGRLNEQFIIIKHDVENCPEKALKISKIENRFGIAATYYVHSFFLNNQKTINIFKEMVRLGHEIGYHFDVLDSNDGDKEKAVSEFTKALEQFESSGFKIKTVCPHGNPMKKRVGYSSNKDFFLDANIRNKFYDICDVYITFPDSVDQKYLYITDAKYSYFLRDAKTTKTDTTEELTPIKGMDEILKLAKDGHSMVISIHSHRYFSFAFMVQLRVVIYKVAKFVARILYSSNFGKHIINKFYYLAKKI